VTAVRETGDPVKTQHLINISIVWHKLPKTLKREGVSMITMGAHTAALLASTHQAQLLLT